MSHAYRLVAAFVLVSLCLPLARAGAGTGGAPSLSREQLVADVGQLVDFVERTHPDPYGASGKLEFHRAVYRLLHELPAEGLSRAEFHARLEPLLALTGDGHTKVQPLESPSDETEDGDGLAVDFRILARSRSQPELDLFVQGSADLGVDLLGARLLTLAGVDARELARRQRRLEGFENAFGNLQNLVWRLSSNKGLRDLLPEWDGVPVIPAMFRTVEGDEIAVDLPLGPVPRSWEGEDVRTDFALPPTRVGEPSYVFLDPERTVAVLRLDNTWAHREVFESLVVSGEGNLNWARNFYRRYHESDPPEDTEALVAGLPPATRLLARLVEEMEAARTQRLVVDLRRNSGGSSMLVNMLLYYLRGRAGWKDFFGNFFTIRRLTEADLSDAVPPEERRFPERVADYDFSGEFRALEQTASEAGSEEYWLATTRSFAEELRNGSWEGRYLPPSVIAVVSPRTFSGGFWLAAALHRMGAELHGVPSGQAGNAFANVRYEQLAHSGITLGVSSRLFVLFPEEPAGLPVLPVDVPLTYEDWRVSGFDPNAEMSRAAGSVLPAGEAASGGSR